jgi:hypothetical protein
MMNTTYILQTRKKINIQGKVQENVQMRYIGL